MSFKSGQKVKIVNIASGHQLPIGTKGTFAGPLPGNPGYALLREFPGRNFFLPDLELMSCNLGQLHIESEERETELQLIKDKISYLEETGNDEVDEDEFKSYQVLKLVEDGDLPIGEKAKRIAAVFKS